MRQLLREAQGSAVDAVYEMDAEMNDKDLADLICRALLAIVAAIRKRYDLPTYKGITIEIKESDTIAGVTGYE